MSTSIISPTHPETLNALYSLDDHLQFERGPGEFTIARMRSPHHEATVSVYGGHVLTFTAAGHEPILWVSKKARFEAGQAIRGGIPVIWPWFGPHDTDPSKPAHGFARNQMWGVHSTSLLDGNTPQLHLFLEDNAISRAQWPQGFSIALVVTLSDVLRVDLVVINTGDNAFYFTNALHTYLNVSDIKNVSIHGLEGSSFIDQLAAMEIKTQQGPVGFDAETDNIHIHTHAPCRLIDKGFNREILVEKRGSASTVIWNPWIEKARRMADFGDEEYLTMVCIETANAGPDQIILNPGEEHITGTTLSVG